MSILSREQRQFIRADTMIDPIIIDRCADAFDALIERGDVEAYILHMHTAVAQMGMPMVTPKDRPTAVDKIKTICVRAYADQQRISFSDARQRLMKLLEGG